MENNIYPPFYVGERVVALVSHQNINGHPLWKKGDEFPVKRIARGCNHYPWIIDIGLSEPTHCDKCGHRAGGSWFSAALFTSLLQRSEYEAITYSKILENEEVCVN